MEGWQVTARKDIRNEVSKGAWTEGLISIKILGATRKEDYNIQGAREADTCEEEKKYEKENK